MILAVITRMSKDSDGFLASGFLPGTASLLSLLVDAFCCVIDFSGGLWSLNSSQLPPLCAKLLLDF